MASTAQARNRILKKMIDRDLTVSALAKRIGKARESVSRAIHQGRNPRVLQLVREELDV